MATVLCLLFLLTVSFSRGVIGSDGQGVAVKPAVKSDLEITDSLAEDQETTADSVPAAGGESEGGEEEATTEETAVSSDNTTEPET